LAAATEIDTTEARWPHATPAFRRRTRFLAGHGAAL